MYHKILVPPEAQRELFTLDAQARSVVPGREREDDRDRDEGDDSLALSINIKQ